MMFRRAQTAARQRPADDALELSHVTYSFGDYTAVKDLSLVIEAGECFGLLGPNGAGKTTTIRLLNTLLPLQGGDVSIFGFDVRTQAHGRSTAARVCAATVVDRRRAHRP